MKVAIIGLGRIGFEFSLDQKRVQPASHVACYNALPEVDTIAVCDSDTSKLAPALATIDKTKAAYSSYQEMLQEFKPEVVSICTPTPTHKQITCDVAKHSSVKSIFLEKPIAQSLKEADEIIEACKNIKLTVNHLRRWDLMYEQLEPLGLEPNVIIGIHPGPLVRTGIHMIDLFNWIMRKKPQSVQAFGMPKENFLTTSFDSDDYNISGCVDYGDSEAVLYSGKWIGPVVLFELDIITDDVRIRITDNGTRMEEFRVCPSHRYGEAKEFCSARSQNRIGWYPEYPLLSAIREVCNSPINSCSGVVSRLALQVALGLHFSAMNKNERVVLRDMPKDYTVRSY